MLLPQIRIGMLISRPTQTSRKLPCAAPATPSTLSRPITMSATTIVLMAPQNVLAPSIARPFPSPFSGSRSLYAIHTSIAPPTKRRPGTCSSQTTIMVIALRTTTARFCRWRGTFRAASAMTIALSPASARSMMTIAARAERNWMMENSMSLPQLAVLRGRMGHAESACPGENRT